MSFTYVRKSKGPKIGLCGTPYITALRSDKLYILNKNTYSLYYSNQQTTQFYKIHWFTLFEGQFEPSFSETTLVLSIKFCTKHSILQENLYLHFFFIQYCTLNDCWLLLYSTVFVTLIHLLIVVFHILSSLQQIITPSFFLPLWNRATEVFWNSQELYFYI